MTLTALQADITTLCVDVIVKAANRSLLGCGGVDGVIHCAAGPALLATCRQLPDRRGTHHTGLSAAGTSCDPHRRTVWRGGEHGELLLASCYRNSLELARQYGLLSVAFPCIRSGVYGYLAEAAAQVAVTTVRTTLSEDVGSVDEVLFVCFSVNDLVLYRRRRMVGIA
ncbi:macro domain-containing protein [Crenobacter oryzisoli]|uniref:macro domain-containing protein n=1 Tax=Crenobacter oryzisoli TaxID=3056844 RepID=UPI003204A26B